MTKMGQKSTHVIFSPFEPSARHSSSWQRSPSAYRVAARREERVEREERERREREERESARARANVAYVGAHKEPNAGRNKGAGCCEEMASQGSESLPPNSATPHQRKKGTRA